MITIQVKELNYLCDRGKAYFRGKINKICPGCLIISVPGNSAPIVVVAKLSAAAHTKLSTIAARRLAEAFKGCETGRFDYPEKEKNMPLNGSETEKEPDSDQDIDI
jgi:hypothetical protein